MRIRTRRDEGGFITLVTLTLMLIMVLLLTINSGTVARLRREVKDVEKQQMRRLAMETNRPALSR